MKNTLVQLVVLTVLTGCSGSADKEEIRRLEARVATLEAQMDKNNKSIDGLIDMGGKIVKANEAQSELNRLNSQH